MKTSVKSDIVQPKISPISDKRILHHIIYQLPDKKKRQGDLTIKLSPGAHTVITDVQYSIAKDDLNAGLC